MSEGLENTSYSLSRAWFDFCFENPERIRPIHTAIYMFAIEHCNRLGWKAKFGFPTSMVMEAIGMRKYQSYIKAFREIVDWGFFDLIEQSRNQYSSNIISLSCPKSALSKKGKALDKAFIKHGSKQMKSSGQSTSQSMGQSKDSINKPINQEQLYSEKTSKNKKFKKPTIEEVTAYCEERKNGINPEYFIDSNEAKGWVVGKTKTPMKDWKAAIRTWENNNKKRPVSGENVEGSYEGEF